MLIKDGKIRILLEVLWLKIAIWILQGRQVTRCHVNSRRDANDMWYMGDKLGTIIHRIKTEYKDV